jgi:molybdopterin synthase catalytic subunit
MRVVVQQAPFDLATELKGFGAGDTGAIVTFTGIVRDSDTGDLEVMEIEHYPGMTESALEKIALEALRRWSLADVLVIHRHGRLKPGEQIMMVATASRHRKNAFEAAEYLMDYLKSRAPFWKKEITTSGADWVAAKADDEAALDRW